MMNTSEYQDNSSVHGYEDCGINHSMVNVVVPSLYFLLFVPGLMLNVTVMWILLPLRTESTFLVYLKNLVAADLLMTLTLPIRAASRLPSASLGLRAFTCRFASTLFYYCMGISIVLMGLISLDRFFKVVQPYGRLLGQNLLFGRTVSIATWTVMLGAVALPNVILTSETPSVSSHNLCIDMKTEVGKDFQKAVILVLNLLFWVMLVVIGFCYTCIARVVVQSYRSSGSTNEEVKRKIKMKVFLVLGVFLVCFTPYFIVQVPYTQMQVENKQDCTSESMKVAKDFTLWLAATQICLDPLIYFFLCRSFREQLSNLQIVRRLTT
ncbi:P2Y purinoceptor 13-like [Alosa sapidissima]|uniref:P2Y purinoceptor 13-like n=1 Tax=Alosa sapidissima TaxID=34773 RepID=UPI001C0A05C6|nr:P2Y purinoceptor 13-like [Alosa sapidissima]